MHITPRPSGRGKPTFTKILCFALEEVCNNLRLFISHKMPATSHYLCDHVAAAKLFGELFGCWPGRTCAIVAFEEEYRHTQLVAVSSHECPILSVGSVQTKSSSQLFGSCISARVMPHDCIGHCLLVLCKAAEECDFKIGIFMAANKPFG